MTPLMVVPFTETEEKALFFFLKEYTVCSEFSCRHVEFELLVSCPTRGGS